MLRLPALCLGLLLACHASAAELTSAPPRVDVNIVTAIDGSDSVSGHEMWLSLGGLAAALRTPEVLAAIRAGRTGRVGFAVFVWHTERMPVVPWTVIASAEDIEAVADALEAAARGLARPGGQERHALLHRPHDRSLARARPRRRSPRRSAFPCRPRGGQRRRQRLGQHGRSRRRRARPPPRRRGHDQWRGDRRRPGGPRLLPPRGDRRSRRLRPPRRHRPARSPISCAASSSAT